MKFILALIAFSFPLGVLSQVDTVHPDQLNIQFDSVSVAIWDIYFKELSLPDDEVYPSRQLAQSTLTKAQAEKLLDQLKNDQSYNDQRANISHHDVEIEFYLNGKLVLKLEISAMTGDIDIHNKISQYSFQNNCSRAFGGFLLSILEEVKLLETAGYDDLDVEGLKHY